MRLQRVSTMMRWCGERPARWYPYPGHLVTPSATPVSCTTGGSMTGPTPSATRGPLQERHDLVGTMKRRASGHRYGGGVSRTASPTSRRPRPGTRCAAWPRRDLCGAPPSEASRMSPHTNAPGETSIPRASGIPGNAGAHRREAGSVPFEAKRGAANRLSALLSLGTRRWWRKNVTACSSG